MQTIEAWLEAKKNKTSLFIDQDETLLVTRHRETVVRMGHWANNNAVFTNIYGNDVGIILRPGVKEFLGECKKIAPTYILTAGSTPFQLEVLEAVGVLDLVEEVYGRDRYHAVPKDRAGILVEDRRPNDIIVVEKLQAMGGGVVLTLPAWDGMNKDDKFLSKAIPRIRKVFSSV